MNQVWQDPPKERLKTWRDFRNDLDSIEYEEDCLQAVVDWWKLAPISSRELDIYDHKSWPDPWQLIYNNKLDENSIALGMAYTLHLIGWQCELVLLQNTKENWVRVIVLVDNEYVLNYTYGVVENTEVLDSCTVVDKHYTSELTK